MLNYYVDFGDEFNLILLNNKESCYLLIIEFI